MRRVGHIGVLVKDIEKTVGMFVSALKLPLPEIKDVEERKMKVCLVDLDNISIEFIEDYSGDGFFSKIVEDKGPIIHHLAMVSDNFERDIEDFKNRCIPLVDEPKIGLRGKRIVFLKPDLLGGIIVEITEP